MDKTIIRASSISSYADCPRRSAARLYKHEIEGLGYKLNETVQSIGGIIGTAMHVATAHSLLEKKMTGEAGNKIEAEHKALESLATQVQNGVLWDKEADNLNSAQKQTLSLVSVCRDEVVRNITPIEVEIRLEAKVTNEITLSGQVDVNVEQGIVDWKSGKLRRFNAAQYGAYSLLAKSHGLDNKSITEIFIPRVRETKPQPKAEYHAYDVPLSENMAISVLKHMDRNLSDFRQTKDPREFLANPSSMLCSAKYCTAWGTEFCKEHKKSLSGEI